MNKQELIRATAKRAEFTQADVEKVVNAIQEITYETLAAHEEVKLINGVNLYVAYREAREGRNPRTGESISIPGKYAVKCKLTGSIKKVVS